ncbi:MAG: alkaline phosphatase family protein [Erysipelotrichaceae bacterium]|nr:alkaline phosphatase family protein [Erysipelotrichaceae bacterium]
MKTLLPDYSNSILNLSNSILKYYGVNDISHSTLKIADDLLNKNHKNVILCLFDGMGFYNLEEHKSDAPYLYEHINKPLSSVFPPTTVAATTAVLSGKSPIETSWLGWDLYFKELDQNIDIFPNKLQMDYDTELEYIVSEKYIPYKNIFSRINEVNSEVTTNFISNYGDIHYKDLSDALNILKDINSRNERRFSYFYYTFPDAAMHKYGINSKEVTDVLKEIDSFVKDLSESMEDTLIMCIADHGLIDIDWLYLEEYPDIYKMLERVPSIEARAASLFVKDEYKNDFELAFNKEFSEYFLLVSKKDILKKNLFGEGKPHPRSEGFIGDYLAIATDKYCMGISRMEDNLKALHAGITEKEMMVPFIVIEK